jgi:DNA-binding transcriptional ArsR family regulator
MRYQNGDETRRRILEFVVEFCAEHGYAPVLREMAEGLNVGMSTVNYHLLKLAELGLIHPEYNRRTLRLTTLGYELLEEDEW